MKNSLRLILLMLIVICMGSLLVGCSNESPKSAAKEFIRVINDQDVVGMENILSSSFKDDLKITADSKGYSMEEAYSKILSDLKAGYEQDVGLDWYSKIKFKDLDSNDRKANVLIYTKGLVFKKNEVQCTFVKEDEVWKFLRIN